MVNEDDESPSFLVDELAVRQDKAHVFTAILVATRRRSAERVDDNDIYSPPLHESFCDRCNVLSLEKIRRVSDD